jgi:septal ring factor EnvC (AmiA/AmiB activator)
VADETRHPATATPRPAGPVHSLYVRRLLTVAGVISALLLGLGSIRAAAAWTATSASLAVAPVSVSALQSRLMDEQDRSAALLQQLQALESQSTDLASALEAANVRIEADANRAKDLAAQLKTAKERLARLAAEIASANQASRARVASATLARAPTTSRLPSGGDDD